MEPGLFMIYNPWHEVPFTSSSLKSDLSPTMELTSTINRRFKSMFSGPRGRDLREYLTAYLLLAPALILIFTFGIFPVGFALYVSLHKWLIIRDEFRGLANYVAAMDNLAYIGLFALGLASLAGSFLLLRRIRKDAKEQELKPWLLSLPASLHAAAILAFVRWIYFQIPEFLDIATKMRGLERTRDLFTGLLREAFFAESSYWAWQQFIWVFLLSLLAGGLALYFLRIKENSNFQLRFAMAWLSIAVGIGLLWFTYQSVSSAYAAAFANGEDPGIWPQIVTVGSGVILLIFAWRMWRSAEHQDSNWSFVLRILGATGLIVGAVLLIVEIPTIVASGDKDMWDGIKVTVFFSLGTVPVQLSIALFLSVLLFQRLKGSEVFRIIYFLPYVTPAVASATVFRVMFSERPQSPANTVLSWLGIQSQAWLREPDGMFTKLANALGATNYPHSLIPDWFSADLTNLLADWMAGPSQALLVVIMLSVWTFVGYNTVIYLAGLANIPGELTEAAEIDGASKWDVFRHITFPLLSPTTYFLSLIAVMGTFKAFNTIWVMRLGQALGTIDTFSVVIFEEFFSKARYGYASALAFVLFGIILGLTYINNKTQGSRVFYG